MKKEELRSALIELGQKILQTEPGSNPEQTIEEYLSVKADFDLLETNSDFDLTIFVSKVAKAISDFDQAKLQDNRSRPIINSTGLESFTPITVAQWNLMDHRINN